MAAVKARRMRSKRSAASLCPEPGEAALSRMGCPAVSPVLKTVRHRGLRTLMTSCQVKAYEQDHLPDVRDG